MKSRYEDERNTYFNKNAVTFLYKTKMNISAKGN